MAVPTITSLDVTVGPTQGRTLVIITGTGFRTPPPPVSNGPTPVPHPTVRVMFGSEAAYEVRTEGATKVWCLTPVQDPGAVTVVVSNLDDDGEVIEGEEAELADGFTFIRPPIRNPANPTLSYYMGDLYRLVGQIIVEWRRQVLENTVLKKPNSDFSAAPEGARTRLAELPGVVLYGPTLQVNRFLTEQAHQNETTSSTTFKARRPVEARDVLFDFDLISDNMPELLNLMQVVDRFFDKNTTISMLRNQADPSKGRVEFELLYTTPASVEDAVDPGNNCSATGSFYVRGFEMQDTAGFTDDAIEHRGFTVESVTRNTHQETP